MPPKGRSKGVGKGKGRAQRKTIKPPSPTVHDDIGDVSARSLSPLPDNDWQTSQGTEDSGIRPPPSPSDSQTDRSSYSSTGMSRKVKKSCRLKDEEEEGQLLEWIEEHPCLWTLKNKVYKNKSIKNRLWEEKASELGYDVESLKVRYTDLRDWNIKLHSQRSGDGQRELTDRERWVMDRFMFLRSTIRHRRVPVQSVSDIYLS